MVQYGDKPTEMLIHITGDAGSIMSNNMIQQQQMAYSMSGYATIHK